jgi:plastocyanin
MHTERRRPRPHRRLAASAAAAGAAVALLAGGASTAAAADCGTQAAAQPFIDHLDSAHLERSPMQQVQDIMHLDSYVLAHTVLVESMLTPLVPTVTGVVEPFVEHVDAAHLERSPMQQVQDIMHTDDYVLAHTVLVESMLKPVLGSCSDATGGAPEPMPAHGSRPAAPPPAAPAAAAIGIHDYAYDPATLSIPVGTTVSWTNHDADSHTVTGSGLKSKSLAAGETYSFAFMQAGTFAYACALHPQMKGTITVA